jgi:hypothetical protein
VQFRAETDLYCRIPAYDGDLQGRPRHIQAFGESMTKKDAQKAAAIHMLEQLASLHILHIPGIYKRRVHEPVDIHAGALHVKKILADRCLHEWSVKPTYDALPLPATAFPAWTPDALGPGSFECVARVTCPWMPGHFFTAAGKGVSRKDAERDAAQNLLNLLLPYFEELDKARA